MMEYLDPATQALKHKQHWHSQRLETDVEVVRWGSYGVPLLLFPTAGGDAEEVERFFLVKQLESFIHQGRLKVYSVDSLNGRSWVTHPDIAHRVWMHKQYDEFIRHEVVPLIRNDCESPDIEVITSGASIGALNALICICRHPDVFSTAICMSGTYDIEKWMEGQWFDEFYYYSPLHFVPGLAEGPQLEQLRQRMVLIPTGQGTNEDVEESWRVAHVLGEKNIPNRVDLWDASWHHDWVTWRAMLPKYVQEVLAAEEA